MGKTLKKVEKKFRIQSRKSLVVKDYFAAVVANMNPWVYIKRAGGVDIQTFRNILTKKHNMWMGVEYPMLGDNQPSSYEAEGSLI